MWLGLVVGMLAACPGGVGSIPGKGKTPVTVTPRRRKKAATDCSAEPVHGYTTADDGCLEAGGPEAPCLEPGCPVVGGAKTLDAIQYPALRAYANLCTVRPPPPPHRASQRHQNLLPPFQVAYLPSSVPRLLRFAEWAGVMSCPGVCCAALHAPLSRWPWPVHEHPSPRQYPNPRRQGNNHRSMRSLHRCCTCDLQPWRPAIEPGRCLAAPRWPLLSTLLGSLGPKQCFACPKMGHHHIS